jgi:hypothetical protein
MKRTCHAAALALVGWYLMFPPASQKKAGLLQWNADAPLSSWKTAQSFDTATECEAALQARRKEGYSEARLQSKEMADGMRGLVDSAVCVSSDDPRLNSPW